MTHLLRLKDQLHNQWKHDYRSLKSELKYSYFEAFLSSFIVGIAESFFAAFSIEKGMSTIQSGLLLSLPPILAVVINLIFNFYSQKMVVSHQVKRNVLLQAFSITGLIIFSMAISQHSSFSFWGLLGLYSIYWFGYFSSLPAWNLWISELLHADRGHDYFTLRTRMIQIGTISGLITGGAILQWKSLNWSNSYLFGLLFSTALLGLLLKFYSFNKHSHSSSVVSFSFPKMKKIFQTNRNFFNSYGLFNTSIYLSTNYVTGYLLITRQIDYFHFMLITACSFAGKISTTYILNLQKTAPRPIRLMTLGGLLAAPLPLLWPYCPHVEAMYILNFTSGALWSLWEIGLALIFFKDIPAREKIETVTLYNIVGISTQMIGTCVGALFIKYVFNSDYTYVFLFAGIMRFLCVLPFQKNKGLSMHHTQTLNSKSETKPHLSAG